MGNRHQYQVVIPHTGHAGRPCGNLYVPVWKLVADHLASSSVTLRQTENGHVHDAATIAGAHVIEHRNEKIWLLVALGRLPNRRRTGCRRLPGFFADSISGRLPRFTGACFCLDALPLGGLRGLQLLHQVITQRRADLYRAGWFATAHADSSGLGVPVPLQGRQTTQPLTPGQPPVPPHMGHSTASVPGCS